MGYGLSLVVLGMLISPTAMVGQVPDSGRRAASTTGSVLPADSSRPPSDTVRPKTPPDKILSLACAPPGSTALASDLLVIVFAPEAKAADRAAIAKSVHGKLLGLVPSGEAGAYYLGVPSGGNEYALRVFADRLIQLAMVRQVEARSCPPP
jgi:hypothetical protein